MHAIRKLLPAFAVSLSMLLGACDSSESETANQTNNPTDPTDGATSLLIAIEDQSVIWDSFAIESYTYRYNAIPVGSDPGCPVVDIPNPIFVDVENGSVVRATVDGTELSVERYQTFTQVFDTMRENIDRIVRTPRFSASLGYPERYTTSDPIEDCPSWEIDYIFDYCGTNTLDCGSAQRTPLTRQRCEVAGGVFTGDPGDGSVHRADFLCESGLPPRGTISEPDNEGAVCC